MATTNRNQGSKASLIIRRGREERLAQAAGGLAFATVLSMVPLLAFLAWMCYSWFITLASALVSASLPRAGAQAGRRLSRAWALSIGYSTRGRLTHVLHTEAQGLVGQLAHAFGPRREDSR